jgi:ATP-dependent DNA helicase RecG
MTAMNDRLDEAVARLRLAGTDLQDIEAKSAAGGFPKSISETVSAFANGDGGMILLGLDEGSGFVAMDVDAAKLAADLAAACIEQLEPPIRPDIDIASVDGKPVVVAVVDALPPERKPCYVKSRGIDRGSFIRTHDGDRRLSTYEVHVLASSRGQFDRRRPRS